MAKITKALSEQIADQEGLIRGYQNLIRSTTSTLENPQFYERKRESLLATIALAQKELADLDHAFVHGKQTILEAHERIEELHDEVKALRHKHKIEQLMALAAAINSLEGEDDEDETEE